MRVLANLLQALFFALAAGRTDRTAETSSRQAETKQESTLCTLCPLSGNSVATTACKTDTTPSLRSSIPVAETSASDLVTTPTISQVTVTSTQVGVTCALSSSSERSSTKTTCTPPASTTTAVTSTCSSSQPTIAATASTSLPPGGETSTHNATTLDDHLKGGGHKNVSKFLLAIWKVNKDTTSSSTENSSTCDKDEGKTLERDRAITPETARKNVLGERNISKYPASLMLNLERNPSERLLDSDYDIKRIPRIVSSTDKSATKSTEISNKEILLEKENKIDYRSNYRTIQPTFKDFSTNNASKQASFSISQVSFSQIALKETTISKKMERENATYVHAENSTENITLVNGKTSASNAALSDRSDMLNFTESETFAINNSTKLVWRPHNKTDGTTPSFSHAQDNEVANSSLTRPLGKNFAFPENLTSTTVKWAITRESSANPTENDSYASSTSKRMKEVTLQRGPLESEKTLVEIAQSRVAQLGTTYEGDNKVFHSLTNVTESSTETLGKIMRLSHNIQDYILHLFGKATVCPSSDTEALVNDSFGRSTESLSSSVWAKGTPAIKPDISTASEPQDLLRKALNNASQAEKVMVLTLPIAAGNDSSKDTVLIGYQIPKEGFHFLLDNSSSVVDITMDNSSLVLATAKELDLVLSVELDGDDIYDGSPGFEYYANPAPHKPPISFRNTNFLMRLIITVINLIMIFLIALAFALYLLDGKRATVQIYA